MSVEKYCGSMAFFHCFFLHYKKPKKPKLEFVLCRNVPSFSHLLQKPRPGFLCGACPRSTSHPGAAGCRSCHPSPGRLPVSAARRRGPHRLGLPQSTQRQLHRKLRTCFLSANPDSPAGLWARKDSAVSRAPRPPRANREPRVGHWRRSGVRARAASDAQEDRLADSELPGCATCS